MFCTTTTTDVNFSYCVSVCRQTLCPQHPKAAPVQQPGTHFTQWQEPTTTRTTDLTPVMPPNQAPHYRYMAHV